MLPGLAGADWEGGICTANLWLVTDTGVGTLFGTDTACEGAVVTMNRSEQLDDLYIYILYSIAYRNTPSKSRGLMGGAKNEGRVIKKILQWVFFLCNPSRVFPPYFSLGSMFTVLEKETFP